MSKKVKYKAEVMSVNVKSSPNYLGYAYENTIYKVDDIIELDTVFLSPPITIKLFPAVKTDKETFVFTQLTDSLYLNGGSWKLIPYYE